MLPTSLGCFFFFFKALVVAVGVVHVFVWIDNIYSVPPQRKDEKMEKRWHRAVSFPCLDLSNTQQRAICHLTDELTLAVQIYGLIGTVISRVHKTLLNMLWSTLINKNIISIWDLLPWVRILQSADSKYATVSSSSFRRFYLASWAVLHDIDQCEILFTANKNKM